MPGSDLGGQVDYRLARNAIVSEYRKGRLSRLEVCDAHPELIRAATSVGEESSELCPICEESQVRLVSYVFGAGLGPSGRLVTTKTELKRLTRISREMTCYIVEVCPECRWHHLAQSFTVTARQLRKPRVTTT